MLTIAISQIFSFKGNNLKYLSFLIKKIFVEYIDVVFIRMKYSIRSVFYQKQFEQIIFTCFLIGLAWLPAWLGSNRFVPWGINAIYFGVLALCYEVQLVIRGHRHPVGFRYIFIPTFCFILIYIFILFQITTWAPQEWRHSIWLIAADGLEVPVRATLSINPDLTTIAMVRLVTSASVFWLSLNLCRNEPRAYMLMLGISIIGSMYALFGIISNYFFSGNIFWFSVPQMGGYMRSTFVNQNSYATYAGIVIMATLGCIVRSFGTLSITEISDRRTRLIVFFGWLKQEGVLVGAVMLVSASLLETGSRGGVLASLVGLLGFLGLLLQRSRAKRLRGRKNRLDLFFIFGALFIVIFISFGDSILGRFLQYNINDSNRLSVYNSVIKSIADRPFLGFGYGTFVDIFPFYRDRSLGLLGFWDKAHNSYLETVQGLGVIFGGIMIYIFIYLFFKCVKGVKMRKKCFEPSCAAAGASLIIGAHSLVDFSLQIQAVTLTFLALLGAGVAQSASSRLDLSSNGENQANS